MDIEDLRDRYPSIADLASRARRRMPHFAWEYVDSGTGLETAVARNREALDRICMTPRFMKGSFEPEMKTTLFGREYSAPFGVAPVGVSSLMWPGAELMLARMAVRNGIAYGLSTVACETPEAVGAVAGANGWFQLYPVQEAETEADILNRAEASGFSVLLVTVDVPIGSTRERQRKAGLRSGTRTGPARLAQIAARPAWAAGTLRRGSPKFVTLQNYLAGATPSEIAGYISTSIGIVDVDQLKRIRDRWKGPLVVKGILSEQDAETCVQIGADGIVVSNHGGRQFDAAPASIDALARIAPAFKGKTSILFDSGIRTGLDIARALALGADFVLAGRAFIFGVAALGEQGGDLVAHIFKTDLANNMIQLGCKTRAELKTCLLPSANAGVAN